MYRFLHKQAYHTRKMMKLARIGHEDLNNKLNDLPMLTGTSSTDDVDYTDYRFEAARLNSFVGWNVPYIDPQKLAAAGLYYTGQEDIVKCFECGTVLAGWLEGDDAMIEHQRWSGRCRFVRNIACGNIPIGIDPSTVPSSHKQLQTCGLYGIRYMPNSGPDNLQLEETTEHNPIEINSKDTEVKVFYDSDSDDVSFIAKFGDVMSSKQPKYACYEQRLRTFAMWPENKVQKKEDLAAAGFWYLGYGDQTMCFFCEGCLKDWMPTDNPVEEHFKWFPDCAFIKKVLAKKQLRENADLQPSSAA
ncbi:death-associated inhibitor of apoptosis 1-like isoform X2 [Pogonomyrmex barbatus]|uniref:Death-associated inhibitor of apoptosis 1-like isoform X2 n=1 Tax=Pogonomyrmex barbatus TaxID=144034 RepID=A0A6I9VP64_9HYME|nr:death-associated inhibitor of apoptosis 1-like isoform X2 [Pogonomyrmex barbatus]